MPILPAKPSTRAAARPTEGTPRGVSAVNIHKRRRGRPSGAKNKPKGLVPRELAEAMLLPMANQVPAEHLDYMRQVVIEGKAVSAEREIQIMAFLLARNLWPAMIQEMSPLEDDIDPEIAGELGIVKKAPEFRKDVTERLKVWNSMWDKLRKMEEDKSDQGKPNRSQPIIEIFTSNGIGPDRIGILIGAVSSTMGGSTDPARRQADSARAIPDSISERQLSISGGEQE